MGGSRCTPTQGIDAQARFAEADRRLCLFEQYGAVIAGPEQPIVRDPRLLMDASGDVKIYYAPLDWFNPSARVVLVGITPGPTQMNGAIGEARKALSVGMSSAEALKVAKISAAFSGKVMRTNLIRQLNHWGFQHWLGLGDAAELFESSSHLLQTTSLLRYPVFVRDEDYRGNPKIIGHPLLEKYLLEYFVAEVGMLPDAVFVSLGPTVQKTLGHLVQHGILQADRVIGGMLHPSGNCTFRISYLIGNRQGSIPYATNPSAYDAGRRAFQERYLGEAFQ